MKGGNEMKKNIITILISIIVIFVVAFPSNANSSFKKGDINGDTHVNGLDLLLLKKHILDIENFVLQEGSNEFLAADMNDDGKINGMDLLLMKKIILGMGSIKYPIAIDEINFPDYQFRKDVMEFDLDGDGYLSEEEIMLVTEIEVAFDRFQIWLPGDPPLPERNSILSLKGIEYFYNIEYLSCSANYLIELDVSKNTKLKILSCYKNNLTELDVSTNLSLTNIKCYSNNLKILDVKKNIKLDLLRCDKNVIVNVPEGLVLSNEDYFNWQEWKRN